MDGPYLTDITEIDIQYLDEDVDGLHQQQLIICDICTEDEVQASISTVDQLEILILAAQATVRKEWKREAGETKSRTGAGQVGKHEAMGDCSPRRSSCALLFVERPHD